LAFLICDEVKTKTSLNNQFNSIKQREVGIKCLCVCVCVCVCLYKVGARKSGLPLKEAKGSHEN